MRANAQQIYDMLMNEDNILQLVGQIGFNLGGVELIVKRKDVIGNIIQEWLEEWLDSRDIEFDANPNQQMPPDVFLNREDHTQDLLEIKAFNYESSPGFDIADFKAFVNELIEKPYYLDTDFLIFGYRMNAETGEITIENLWLKKIWQITKTMSSWPITVQYKNGNLQKMRPGKWYSTRSSTNVFESKEHYLAAFEETVYQNPETHHLGAQWRNRFRQSYREHYRRDIDFPRWDEIRHIYNR